jgi:hypothetical protein
MIARPSLYLNGTAPLNVTGAALACVYPLGGGTSNCTRASSTGKDSFVWYDELHPSEQADRALARAVVDLITSGNTTWTELY